MGERIRLTLRERCCQLALCIRIGVLPIELLDDIESLARDAWAVREGEDA